MRRPVRLRSARACKVLGIALATSQIETLLQGLGFPVKREGEDFIVTPPAYRYDIEIEEDLIEELARLHGYDNIPAPAPQARLDMHLPAEVTRTPMQLRRLMAGREFHEVINYSFVDAAWEADFCGNPEPIRLSNPIASQMSVMRSSLIGGLIDTLAFNLKRRTSRVRIFEIGRCFSRVAATADRSPGAAYHQPVRLAALCAGPASPAQWGEAARNVDFYDLKADVEALLGGTELSFERLSHPALHPGRAATIRLAGEVVGMIGELHPAWVQKYELGMAPVVCEMELAALSRVPLPTFQPVSRFPAVERDIALLVDQSQAVQPLLDVLQAAAPGIVQTLQLFDVYQGKGVGAGQKSLAFHIVMQDTAGTLADAEVDAAVATLVDAAARKFGASLRT